MSRLKIILICSFLLPSSVGFTQARSPLFKVSPATIRNQLVNSGLTLKETALRVKQAKLSVEVARGKLLPSLNLGVMVGSMANPAFLLGSVDYVVPFLLPSRWFDFYKSKNLVDAEKQGFLITELNLYASTVSMAANLLNDLKTRQILYYEMRDWIEVENLVRQAVEDDRAVLADLDRARSQTAGVRIRIGRLNELLVQEMASLKKILNLPVETEIQFLPFEFERSQLEDLELAQAIKKVFEISPERKQVFSFIQAAKQDRFSKIFAFMSGASAGNVTRGLNPNEGASMAFGDQVGRFNFQFGYDYWPTIKIAETQIKMLQIRENEIRNELSRVTTEALADKEFIEERMAQASSAAELLERVFIADQKRYGEGLIPLIQVFESQRQWRAALVENLRATTDLMLMRISMDRLIRAGQFSYLKGCETMTAYGKGGCTTKGATARFGK
ncbi:MAG: hypothetical protein RJB66_2646 [Pseudomonadota bacterium]